MPLPTPVEQAEMSMILIFITIAGTTAWILAAYVGPIVAFVRAPHRRVTKLLHAAGYIVIYVAQRLRGASVLVIRFTVGQTSRTT